MRPTRLRGLAAAILLLGVLGYLVAEVAYFDLPPLPAFAPVSLLMLTVLEVGMAKVVRDRIAHTARPTARPMHPISVARVAVLAKASSLGGALLAGFYGGVFAWTFARRDTYGTAGDDARVAGLSAVAALALVVAALVMERACRTPDEPDLG